MFYLKKYLQSASLKAKIKEWQSSFYHSLICNCKHQMCWPIRGPVLTNQRQCSHVLMHRLSDSALIFKFSNLENETNFRSALSSLQNCPLTNQRPVLRSRDQYWPIRGQYYLSRKVAVSTLSPILWTSVWYCRSSLSVVLKLKCKMIISMLLLVFGSYFFLMPYLVLNVKKVIKFLPCLKLKE